MISTCEWFPRLPGIIEAFERVSAASVGRPVFEKIFAVKRRRAIELLHEFGARKRGAEFVVSRATVLKRLNGMRGEWEAEQERQARLAADLAAAQRLATARRVRIATAPDVAERTIADLPSAIHLQPGELRIEFHGAEDLLAQLYELSQAAARDYDAFVARCDGPETAKAGEAA